MPANPAINRRDLLRRGAAAAGLAGAGLLMAGSALLPALHAAVDSATPAYLAAMAEPSEWGAEKFWLVNAREHGVDAADPAQLARFAAAAEDGEVAVDQDLLAAIEDRDEMTDRKSVG